MEEVFVIFYYDKGDNTEPRRICQFTCRKYAELLRFLHYCKKYEIEFWPREDDENMDKQALEEMAGIGPYIDDIAVRFGSDDVIQCIDVYLK